MRSMTHIGWISYVLVVGHAVHAIQQIRASATDKCHVEHDLL